MKVLLINPSHWVGKKAPLGSIKVSSVPLGLGYIAAVLESHSILVKILDMEMGNIDTDKGLREKIIEFNPDVVGITSFTSNYPNAVLISRTVKSVKPDTLVVLGGVHATFAHENILQTVPEIDVIVRHEGEHTMLDLIDILNGKKSLDSVEGISYRRDGKVIANQDRPKIENLDDLPYPALHLLDPPIQYYIGDNIDRCMSMITTRGCPFECVFCATAALHGHKYRTRRIDKVLEEIEYLIEKYKINRISFVDDSFTLNKNRVYELCRGLNQRDLNLKWGCSTRIDLLSEDLLKEMKSSGCDDIFFGLESASQGVLNTIKKGFSIEEAKDVVKMTERIGIKSHCSFIIGLPGETVGSANKMVEFVREVKPSGRILPNILEVTPGTELWNRKEGYLPIMFGISSADATRLQLELYYSFFSINFKTDGLFRIKGPNIRVQ